MKKVEKLMEGNEPNANKRDMTLDTKDNPILKRFAG